MDQDPTCDFRRPYDRSSGKNDPGKRAKVVDGIKHWGDGAPPMELSLVDEHGHVIYPAGEGFLPKWESIPKPGSPTKALRSPIWSSENSWCDSKVLQLNILLIHDKMMPPPGMGPPMGPHGPMGPPPLKILFLAIGPMLISILLGIGLSMALFFRSLGEKAKLADSVIAELQSGNLSARFPITKMDEVGQAMQRFNRMAEEISHLVEQVKSAEKSRMRLLQELAHDLRTPVASLKSLIENLDNGDAPIDPRLHGELIGLSLKEVDYFERLVEDLLVLAQVSEPRYQADSRKNIYQSDSR